MGRRGATPAPKDPPATLRLDKWIWCARFLRAREDCAQLVRDGHVRINGRRVVQPGATLRIGDVVTLALPGTTRVLRVRDVAERRGDAASAAGLFEDIGAGT